MDDTRVRDVCMTTVALATVVYFGWIAWDHHKTAIVTRALLFEQIMVVRQAGIGIQVEGLDIEGELG